MTQVSKNYKLGFQIYDLRSIKDLADLGESIAYKPRFGFVKKYNVKPAAFLQNWSVKTASNYDFYTILPI
jgi:hypothetical protein